MKKAFTILLLIYTQNLDFLKAQSAISRISVSINQYKSLQNELSNLEKKYKPIRDTCLAKENMKGFLLKQIDDEMLVASNEFRQGYYCSQCSRPKSQIEREERVTFEQHLKDVSGRAIPFTESQIVEALKPYQNKKEKIVNEVAKACDAEKQTSRDISDRVTLSLMLESDIMNSFKIWKEEKAQKIANLRSKERNKIELQKRERDKILSELNALNIKIGYMADRSGKLIKTPSRDTSNYSGPILRSTNQSSNSDEYESLRVEGEKLTAELNMLSKKLTACDQKIVNNHEASLNEYKSLIKEIITEGELIRNLASNSKIYFEDIDGSIDESSSTTRGLIIKVLDEVILEDPEEYYANKLSEYLRELIKLNSDINYRREQEVTRLDNKLSNLIGQYRLFFNN
jgi:hypothetical protein